LRPPPHSHRDVEPPDAPDGPIEPRGRKVIAVAGINDYAEWPTLRNAGSDARGALELFTRLGFELAAAPLFDRAATGEALRRLVADDLAKLGPEDSLVVFFAGHGFTRTHSLANAIIKTGYIIPADGEAPPGSASTWVRLDSWLSDVARLPVKHVLVILDACYSGVALDAVVTWRGIVDDGPTAEPLAQLRARQSRRVITSALENEQALDSGPVPGHSLFTGCLIEALTGGLARDGKREVTGSELGQYVQRRVTTFPGSRQTPDYGALELDDRGEIMLPIVVDPARAVSASAVKRRRGYRRWLLAANAAGLALLAALAWSAVGSRDPAPAGQGRGSPDAAVAPVDAAPASDAALADAMSRHADAAVSFTDGPAGPRDAATDPIDAPHAPHAPSWPRKCWVMRDDVHADPRSCDQRGCPAGCISAASEDAPVRVPPSAFTRCAEVWICERAPVSR